MLKFFSLFLFFCFSTLSVVQGQDQDASSSDEQLAAQYLRQGEYEKALVLYEELFEKNPTPVIFNNYLTCLLEMEEFRRAERVVQQQIDNNPGNVRFKVDLGYVYDKAGDNRKLRRHFDALVRNLQPNPGAVNDLANAFLFRNYDDRAMETYNKGRSMLGDTHPFNLQIASLHSKEGDYTAMMREYVDLMVLDETSIDNVQGLLQDELNEDPELLKSDALRRILLQRSQQNPSHIFYPEMLLWLSLQQKDFPMALRQARILDRRMDQQGSLVMEVGRLSVSNSQYAVGRQAFEAVVELGNLTPFYLDARVGLLDVKYRQAIAGYDIDFDLLREAEAQYKEAIEEMGVHAQTVILVRNLAHLQAFYLGNIDGAVELLQVIIDLPNVSNRVKAECRVELADILLLKGDLWDAHLLYAQVDKSFRDDPLAHEARFKNARLSFYMGEFKWAKAQLDVLKAATSRLIANDAMALSLLIQDNLDAQGNSPELKMYARAEKLTFMNDFSGALAVLDSLQELSPSHQIMDDALMTSALIHLRTGRYETADGILARIASEYPKGLLAADALFQRALLQERNFENIELAMELYQKIMVDYSGSLNTANARNRFRYLRGDLSPEEEFFYYYHIHKP